jgi:helix-turn-helix protein
MNNPNASVHTQSTLKMLAAQVNELTARLEAALAGNPDVQATLAKSRQEPQELIHPLEAAILDLLAPGVALTVTDLATKLKSGRPGVHYHVKRLILSDHCRVIRAHKARHVVDYVTLVKNVPIPGIDVK